MTEMQQPTELTSQAELDCERAEAEVLFEVDLCREKNYDKAEMTATGDIARIYCSPTCPLDEHLPAVLRLGMPITLVNVPEERQVPRGATGTIKAINTFEQASATHVSVDVVYEANADTTQSFTLDQLKFDQE